MGKPIAGRVTLRFDGQKYETEGGCEIDAWNFEGDSITADNGKTYQKVKPKAEMIKNLSFLGVDGLTTESLKQHFNGCDVTFEDTDSGLIYYYNDAFVVGSPTYKSTDGVFSGIDFTSNNVRVVTP